MSKQQTAVEFLEKLWKQEILFPYSFTMAKEMEKQQIIEAYLSDRFPCSDEDAEEYYNETYGSKGSDETKTNNI